MRGIGDLWFARLQKWIGLNLVHQRPITKKIKMASHDMIRTKAPDDTLRTRTRTTYTSIFYFLRGWRIFQPQY